MAPGSKLVTALSDRNSIKVKIQFAEAAFPTGDDPALGETEVDHILTSMKTCLARLDEVHNKIEELSAPEDLVANRTEYQHLSLKGLKMLGTYSKLKNAFPQQPTLLPVNPTPTPKTEVRLPRLELPTFNGNLSEWVSFRDMFVTAVHDNKSLSKSQKLTYLKSQLHGEAARLLQSMIISDDNYDLAFSQLTNRYQNDREILFATLRKFVNQPNVQSGSSSATRQLVDSSRECIRSIDVLNPGNKFNALMMFHVFTKMDPSSKELWEQGLKDSSIPTLDALFEFLEQRARALAASAPKSTQKPHPNTKHEDGKFQRNPQARNIVHHTQLSSKCNCCPESHPIYRCSKFQSMTIHERVEVVNKHRLCFNCLRESHSAAQCQSTSSCKVCSGKHHTLLHRPTKPVFIPQAAEKKDETPKTFYTQNTPVQQSEKPKQFDTILGTALIQVHDVHGGLKSVRAFLDNGSNNHYITESCIRRLGLPRSHHKGSITGLGENGVGTTRGMSWLTFSPHFDPEVKLSISTLIIPKISGKLPQTLFDHEKWDHLQGLLLADPKYYIPEEVDMLLGAEIFYSCLKNGIKVGPPNSPTAVNSALGWIIGGGSELDVSSKSHYSNHSISKPKPNKTTMDPDECLDGLLRLFWELETVPQSQPLTAEEEACEAHFQSTYKREETGRFTVQIPFKSPKPLIGSSLDLAVRRLKQLERRLNSQQNHKVEYIRFMQEYEALGHMVEIPEEIPLIKDVCYIPHHFVIKESSTTTKLRVVFDASARTTSGVSLNDSMMVGPSIQDNLADIIMRFRLHKVAFTADIAKMYRQVLIAPEHQDYQRIVWREDPSLPIKHYKLLTVTYGTASAPFLATRVIKELATLEKEELPLAAEVALRDLFVDDLMSGAPTNSESLQIQTQLIEMARRGGLQLRKWISNSPAVLESLPPELRETVSLLSFNVDDTVKTLGISWSPLTDHFLFRITTPDHRGKLLTKRAILSEVSKIFDPIGWLAPVVIKAKLLMQEIWKQPVGWDDLLPFPICQDWTAIKNDLPKLEFLKINRHQGYLTSINKCISIQSQVQVDQGNSSPQTVCLVGFCDASERAYAAATYLCIYSNDNHPILTLINSKTRVAPVKQVSLPRLELCGAVLLAELMISVQKALRIPFHSVTCWTDSTVVLGWIRGHPSRWKNFVANRVTKIQNRIPVDCWGHVRGQDNPADCASRGIDSSSLINHHLWWHGPLWLQEGIPTPAPLTIETHEEERPVVCCVTINPNSTVSLDETLLSKFSSLSKLQRVTAIIFRILRKKYGKSSIHRLTQCSTSNELIGTSGPLSTNELNLALIYWVKKSQEQEFATELKCLRTNQSIPKSSKLLHLQPYVDPFGIIRVGGRLRHAKIPLDKKHPMILPHHSKLTKLVISYYHLKNFHAGPQLLLSTLQQKFWIIRAKDIIRYHVRKCVTCTRHRAETIQPMMADLPSFRVTEARAFLRTGVDYAGPLLIRPINPRSKITMKAYLAIFVCCTTRALHLEVVSDLSTDAFLAALRRFISRRGRPTDLYSDCGTNFVGADRQLREMISFLKTNSHNETIANNLSTDGVQWHFNPPAAPHFGGLWEAGVKSVKYHLRRVMGAHRFTFEELTTTVTQIEACLNSRPLTPESSDPNDLRALTPGHFLIGSPLTTIPEPGLSEVALNRLSRWQLLQQLLQHFWRRWSAEYISRLQQRPKWMCDKKSIAINDLVIIKDDLSPPMKWRLGRITKTHPGPDGITRLVTIKTTEGEIKRPVVKLCLLPISHPVSSQPNDQEDII